MHTETNYPRPDGIAASCPQGGRRPTRKTPAKASRASTARTNPWFRLYAETLDDIKVQSLPPELFKAWVNLLCLANLHGGRLPAVEEIAFRLRVPTAEAQRIIDALLERGLLDRLGAWLAPHNWDVRQFRSDCSTERVRRHREECAKPRLVHSGSAAETFHGTAERGYAEPFPSVSVSGSESASSIQGRKFDLEEGGYAHASARARVACGEDVA